MVSPRRSGAATRLRELMVDYRRYGYVAGIAIIGAAVSLFAFVLIERSEDQNAETMFQLDAQEQADALKETIDHDLQALGTIASFYKASETVDRDGFKAFVSSLLESNPSIQALEWIPRVPASEVSEYESRAAADGFTEYRILERTVDGSLGPVARRDEYFPVYFVEPYQGNEAALGFDLGSNQARFAALVEARDTGSLVATEGITLAQADEQTTGLLVFQPIYRNGLASENTDERRAALAGFALAVFRVNIMVERSLFAASALTEQSQFTITVIDDSSIDNRLLYTNSSPIPPSPPENTSLLFSSVIQVAGRPWIITVTPGIGFTQGQSDWKQWGVLGAGLAFTLIIVFYNVGTLRRGIITEMVVAARTGELSASNELLERQIQERMAVEQTLRESESRIRTILDASVDAVISIDQSGLIQTFNPAAETVFGYSSTEVVGHNVDMLMPEPYHSEHHGYLSRYAKEGDPRIIGIGREVVGLRKNGSTFPMDLSVGESGSGDDKVFIGTVRDITELKRTESALQEMARFPSENPNAVLRVNETGDIIYSNHHAEDLLNYWGVRDGAQVPPNILTLVQRVIRQHTAQEEMVEFNGLVIALEITPVTDTTYANLYGRDITERVALEREVASYTATLESAYKELQDLDRLKDGFLSTVSHELRTPLTSIKGFAEILLSYEDMDSSTMKEFITIINEESDRLTRLVTDVLDLAKVEAQRMEWADAEVNIAEVIKSVVTNNNSLIVQSQLNVSMDLEDDLPTVFADKDRITQVLTNLISNAIKFSPQNGDISVVARLVSEEDSFGAAGDVLVRIADTGIGIAEEQIGLVFDKFKQVGDTLTDRPTGTGLGLPICKEIVDHYGGVIWAESQLGKGS